VGGGGVGCSVVGGGVRLLCFEGLRLELVGVVGSLVAGFVRAAPPSAA
jgi:hypothetical protein